MTVIPLLLFLMGEPSSSRAQLLGLTGANHPELDWNQLETDHFVLVYHQGLDSIARVAAPIAEEVYHVVTTNLETPLREKVRIYLSDNDEVRNAFAFKDDYIFVWMRGILDDNLFSLRASGTSKWLRSVLTHEFTHIVIAHAIHTWIDDIIPVPDIPRWFNEGMARYMEPDGWTDDLDIPLRTAAVSSRLELGGYNLLAGVLVYEGGQSLVRYIASKYGDSALVKILKHRESKIFGYKFEAAVKAVTMHSLKEIYDEWHKLLNVYYNTEYGQKEDIEDIGRKISTGLDVVGAARLAPDGKTIAILGKRIIEEGTKLYVLSNDTAGHLKLLTGESGIEPYLSWSPDGKYILLSKIRFGDHASLVYDLFKCDSHTGELERISTGDHLEYPDWSPDGKWIVAAQFHQSGSDLVMLDADGGNLRKLTNFNDGNVDVYSPRWSPDGKHIAFSIFRKNGMRDVAMVDVVSQEIQYITNDSINDRYPIWSPSGDSIALLSFQNGTPNLYAGSASPTTARSQLRQLTDVASNILAWDWSRNKDSILVTSFASANSVQLYWLSAKRSARSAARPSLASKYTDWRSIRWPLVTRPQDSIPPTIVTGPYSYNSLAHIHPLVLLPLLGSDLTRSGDQGTQWGGIAVFADEMQKHILTAFAFYGDVSRTFTYGVEYENNQLLPNIIAGASDILGIRDVLDDIPYYERTQTYNLGFNFGIHTPNSTEKLHDIFFGASYEDLDPWNVTAFDAVLPWHKPLAAKFLDLHFGYGFLSPLFQFGISATHTDKKLASDLTRTKVRVTLHKEIPTDEDESNQVAFIVRGAADFGDELPQDFLGFYKHDAFENGFDITTVHARERLRGIRRYYYGNRLLSGSFELRQRDKFFGSLVPLIHAFEPQFVEFFDIGSAWYANTPDNNPHATVTPFSGTQWLKTVGLELRSELGFDMSLSGGVGWEILHADFQRVDFGPADWYIRVNAGL